MLDEPRSDAHHSGIRARQRQQTQHRILAAARQLFAEAGYERTTIRAIATAAHTDPGLVMRYYGSKQRLFQQVTDIPPEDIAHGTPEEVTERVLASLSAKLVAEPTATLAMLRSALTHPDAAAQLRDTAIRQEHQLSQAIPAPDATLRAALIGVIILGTVIGRHLLHLNGLTTATPEHITNLLRPHIHSLIHATTLPEHDTPGSAAPT